MRVGPILLVIAFALLAICATATKGGNSRLLKALSPGFVQGNGGASNNIRSLQNIEDEANNEERGAMKSIAQKLRSAEVKNKKAKLTSYDDIKADFKTFKTWYKKGNTPEDVWKDLKLGPLYKKYYKYGGIGKLKANPNYQRYLTYDRFYKIMKNQMPKEV